MTAEELIEAVNERAAQNRGFRDRFDRARTEKNRTQLRDLILETVRASRRIPPSSIRYRAEDWFLGS